MPGTKIVEGQVRGQSFDGQPAVSYEFQVTGLAPGTIAHVVMCGWNFDFTYGDHNLYKIGLWLQQAVVGGWQWGGGPPNEVRVPPDGTVRGRYYGFVGSENMDNPFTFLVNWALIGEAA